jgi:hypothetical protein
MDGLKVSLQALGILEIQEQYYNNRWICDHYVTSIFCFCPDGTIPIAIMSPDLCTIVRQWSWVIFIRNLRRFMKKQAANVASTGSTFTSDLTTYWDHWLLPKLRGR